MSKKFLSAILFTAFMVTSAGTFVSCKDYDSDIDNLNNKYDQLSKTVEDLQKSIGKYISSVTYDPATGKLTVTGGDGSSASAIIATDLPSHTIEVAPDGTISLKEGDTVISSGKITFPSVAGFDGSKLSVVNGVLHYDGVATTVKIPANSIQEVKDGDAVVGYTITIDGKSCTFSVVDAAALHSLVFVPQCYVAGIPAMDFSSFEFNPMTKEDETMADGNANKGNATLTREVLAQYNMNPSAVSEAQIDINNLAFDIQCVPYYGKTDAASRSVEHQATATFAGIDAENGRLNVRVSAKSEFFESLASDKIDVIALQVPLTEAAKEKAGAPAQGVVTSDYVSVYAAKKVQAALQIAATSQAKTYADDTYHYPTTFEAAKAQPAIDAEVAFDDQTGLNLNALVKSCYNHEATHGAFDNNAYGFHYEFDMKGFDGKDLVYNVLSGDDVPTDQQKFATIAKDAEGNYRLTAKAYTINGVTYASIDRTPVVRVKLVDKGGRIVRVGYLKVKVIRGVAQPVEIKNIPAYTVYPTCGDDEVTLSAEVMNVYVYDAVNLSKEDFYRTYVFSTEKSSPNVKEYIKANTGEQETISLKWTIANATLWDLNKATDEAKAVYVRRDGSDGDVAIYLYANVDRPTLTYTVADLIKAYWNQDQTAVLLNVRVPNAGEEGNGTTCTFENNLNAAFVTYPSGDMEGQLKLPAVDAKYQAYAAATTYNYYFDAAKNKREVTIGADKYAITVSADGKTLSASKNGGAAEAVAVIASEFNPEKKIYPITYQETANAKALLNTNEFYAYIYIGVQVCDNHIAVIGGKGSFIANFVRPINVASEGATDFSDIADFGTLGTYLPADQVVVLSDWRNAYNPTEGLFSKNPNYWSYYGIQNITLGKATCNLNGEIQDLPSTLEVAFVRAGETWTSAKDPNRTFTANPSECPYGAFVYCNNGTKTQRPFDVYLTVSVTYKWGVLTTPADKPITVHVKVAE